MSAEHRAKFFAFIILFNHHSNPMTEVLFEGTFSTLQMMELSSTLYCPHYPSFSHHNLLATHSGTNMTRNFRNFSSQYVYPPTESTIKRLQYISRFPCSLSLQLHFLRYYSLNFRKLTQYITFRILMLLSISIFYSLVSDGFYLLKMLPLVT